MFGNVSALEGLHVTGKYRDKSMTHTCSRHAAWDPHSHTSSAVNTPSYNANRESNGSNVIPRRAHAIPGRSEHPERCVDSVFTVVTVC